MSIVCSMKIINDRTKDTSSSSSLSECLKKDSEVSDMLGLPISINNVDVSYGLVDQGASSGIITRSLMNQKKLKVKEYKVRNHGILTSSGKEVMLSAMFLASVKSGDKSFGKAVFYIVDDESLPSNELVCDLIIGRSLLANSDYYHMDLRSGQLYNNNNDKIQCEKVSLEAKTINNKEKKVLVPVLLSSILKHNNSTKHQQNITDNMRMNKVRFGLTSLQFQQLNQIERYTKISKHVDTLSLTDEQKVSMKHYMLTNIHRYRLKDEIPDNDYDNNNVNDINNDNNNNEDYFNDDLDELSTYIHKLQYTQQGSDEEDKIIKHIFSIHLPHSLAKQHGVDEKVSSEHDDIPDEASANIDNIEYPMSAPTESINTPEYREEKKQKLRELIQSYTHLTDKQQKLFINMLIKHMDPISINGENMKQTTKIVHEIDTGDTAPFREKLRNYSPAVQDIILKEVDKMISAGVMVESKSPYATNLLLVRKPDKSEETGMKNRVCASFVKLNDRTKKDSYPLPNIQEIFHRIGRSKWFTTMDLLSGFWQVMIKPEHRHKTAVITSRGLFEFVVMAFGLCNAPATFQRLIDAIFIPEMRKFIETYIDDLMTHSMTFDDHVKHVGEVLQVLQDNQLTVKLSKCKFAQLSVKFLGHVISHNEIRINPDAIQPVLDWQRPKPGTNFQKAMRGFLGLTGWYRKFIKNYADIARPLVDLTKKGVKYQWTNEHEKAFITLRNAITSAPVLRAPDSSKDYILHTDASDVAMSGIAQQYDEDNYLHPVAYWSKTFNPAQRNYSVTDRECLALVTALEHFKTLFEGHKYVCLTDHHAIIYLIKNSDSTPRLNRLMLRLAPYELTVKHIPGKDNHGADLLSRDNIYMDKQSTSSSSPSSSSKQHLHTISRNKRKSKAKEYEVETIINKRKNDDNEYEYEVKWKNYDASNNTWESLDNLKNSMELVVLYEQNIDNVNNFGALSSVSESDNNDDENKCPKCDYIGVNYADKCLHLSSVHRVRVPVHSCIPDIYELDLTLIKHLQKNEPEFKIIYDTNMGENIPSDLSTNEKRMLLSHEFILCDNGLLYCIDAASARMRSKIRTQLRLCIPKTLRRPIITQVHSGIFAPHIGVVHTYDKLRENVWWPGMLKYVNQYISECSVCKKNKGNQPSIPVQPMSVPAGPFEHVCLDVIGPLPITPRGNMYMQVAVDRYTRYADGWPMQEQTTKTLATTFINGWVCKHGIPLVVGTDRGSPYLSQLAQAIYKELGIKRTKTTANHPQANGLVERFNRTLKYAMKVWCNENQDDWDEKYHHAYFSYNTLYHSLVQETPFFLATGRDARLHVDIMTGNRRSTTPGVYQYATELVQQLHDVHQRVKEILENENKKRIDDMVPLKQYQIGDKVLLYDSSTKVGLSRKLTKRWKGPYTIIEQNSEVTYTIMNEIGSQLVTVHRLKTAGDEEKNNYLQHEADLSMADTELLSINDTIQHLLTMKADKEKEKLLLKNVINHDKSVIDENGKIINKITVLNDELDHEDEESDIVSTSSSSSPHHINSVSSIRHDNHISYVSFADPHTRALWL